MTITELFWHTFWHRPHDLRTLRACIFYFQARGEFPVCQGP